MNVNEYKCDKCEGIFKKEWSEEEAKKEQSDNGWQENPDEEMAIVCDDCYKKIMGGIKPEAEETNGLLDCPFCGEKAEYYQTQGCTSGHGESSDEVGVKCTGCGNKFSNEYYANYKIDKRKAKTKQLWNNRAIQEEI